VSAPLTLDLNQLLAPFVERIARLEARVAELDNRPSVDPNELITVERAAAEAHISAPAVYKYVARGKVKRHPLADGRRYLVRRGDVVGGAR